jgi:hypothetical protein
MLVIATVMASSDYSAPPAGVQGSVSEVINLVDAELRNLLARREDVSKRIRSLHLAVRALQNFAGGPVSDHAGEIVEGPERHSRTSSGTECVSHAIARNNSQTEARDGVNSNQTLRRACRIALLETPEGLTEQDIHARIVRRGSFSFINAEFAQPAIFQELAVMSKQGEVRCFENGSDRRWQRISGDCDPNAAPLL